jgi:hypothetical protein
MMENVFSDNDPILLAHEKKTGDTLNIGREEEFGASIENNVYLACMRVLDALVDTEAIEFLAEIIFD